MAVITNNGSNNSADNDFYINSLSNDGACETFDMRKSRAGGVITSGDSLGAIFFSGFDGSNYIPGAKITSTNSGTVAAGRVAANLVFLTHPDSATVATTRLTIAPTGELTIATPDSGTALTISGGGCSVTGTVSITAGNLALPTTSSTAGNITVNGTRYWNSYGTSNLFLGDNAGNYTLTTGSAKFNFLIGTDSGSATTTGTYNSALGYRALRLATSGSNNVAIGNNAGENITTSGDNIAIGDGALTQLSTGSGGNTVVGPAAGGQLSSGTFNTLLGYTAGYNYTTTETTNICIGYDTRGTAGESHVFRVGASTGTGTGGINAAYICGIYNTAVGATAGVILADSSNQIGSISGTSSQVLLGGTKPSWGQVNLTTQVTGVLPIANGGTNASSMATTDGVVYYDGTRLVTTSAGTAGQVLTSNGAGVAPTYQTNTSFTWTVTTVNASMVAFNGYIANKAGLLTMTLPTTAAVGDIFEITGINTAVGWRIAQNAGQTIYFGTGTTTTGAGGYIEATAIRDSVRLICVVANNDFNVISSIGNITIV